MAWGTLWSVTGVLALIAILLVILSVVRYVQKPEKVILRKFYLWLGTLAILGGTWAFFLPIAINSGFTKNDDGPTLRQLLIYTTGGVLGVVTLGETRRKNDQEHTRQVPAERRSRYAKAIEQLADEKAPIRLGGIYTLVKLVDEWLADEKTLPNEEERREEGQVIVNSLCAYIRSPFDLVPKAEVLSQDQTPENYEGGDQQFVKDQARFREEQEIRHIILSEIKKRLNGDKVKNKEITQITPGTWSYFEYNFSDAHFFYAVNFNNSYFGASLNFLGATFTGYVNFSGATFTQVIFSGATFTQVIFSGATFTRRTDFSGATFTQVIFFGATFTHEADFTMAAFTHDADFRWVTFTHDADFTSVTFTGEASFIMATFTGYANFSGATFTHDADFSSATFTGEASFLQGADFRRVTFHGEPSFIGVLGKARFSYKVIPEDYRFEVDPDSPCKIETEEQEYNGVKFRIPKGAILFDPDEPPELDDNNDS